MGGARLHGSIATAANGVSISHRPNHGDQGSNNMLATILVTALKVAAGLALGFGWARLWSIHPTKRGR